MAQVAIDTIERVAGFTGDRVGRTQQDGKVVVNGEARVGVVRRVCRKPVNVKPERLRLLNAHRCC
jgi:hypothetical protein